MTTSASQTSVCSTSAPPTAVHKVPSSEMAVLAVPTVSASQTTASLVSSVSLPATILLMAPPLRASMQMGASAAQTKSALVRCVSPTHVLLTAPLKQCSMTDVPAAAEHSAPLDTAPMAFVLLIAKVSNPLVSTLTTASALTARSVLPISAQAVSALLPAPSMKPLANTATSVTAPRALSVVPECATQLLTPACLAVRKQLQLASSQTAAGALTTVNVTLATASPTRASSCSPGGATS
jgi:hypothetical protein